MDDPNGKPRKTFTEEIEVMGNQLVQQVKDLLQEGNVRQLRLKASDGDILFETPLTFGVVAGGAVALAAPWLAILGAIAAFVTHARIEIVREVAEADPGTAPDPAAEFAAKPDQGPATPPPSRAKAGTRVKSAAEVKAKGTAKSAGRPGA